jgi:hypothetical protein
MRQPCCELHMPLSRPVDKRYDLTRSLLLLVANIIIEIGEPAVA